MLERHARPARFVPEYLPLSGEGVINQKLIFAQVPV